MWRCTTARTPRKTGARLLEFIERQRAAGREVLVTGSSDYHGAGKPNLLGENTTDAATVARIREQLAAQH